LAAMNRTYRDRFGFPFIICARQNSREAVFGTLRARLHNDRAQELQISLAQIGEIARLRVMDILETTTAA
jgi:2-oxo-4-hydroxy-4-carboxy-5-ureidoimidazoline decarboxylase